MAVLHWVSLIQYDNCFREAFDLFAWMTSLHSSLIRCAICWCICWCIPVLSYLLCSNSNISWSDNIIARMWSSVSLEITFLNNYSKHSTGRMSLELRTGLSLSLCMFGSTSLVVFPKLCVYYIFYTVLTREVLYTFLSFTGSVLRNHHCTPLLFYLIAIGIVSFCRYFNPCLSSFVWPFFKLHILAISGSSECNPSKCLVVLVASIPY